MTPSSIRAIEAERPYLPPMEGETGRYRPLKRTHRSRRTRHPPFRPPSRCVRRVRPPRTERVQPPSDRSRLPDPEVTPLVPNAAAAVPVHRRHPGRKRPGCAGGRTPTSCRAATRRFRWALQAQQTGEPGAADVMQRTNTAILNQMKELTNQKRFDEALSFVNAYAEYYPVDPAMQRTFQQIRETGIPPGSDGRPRDPAGAPSSRHRLPDGALRGLAGDRPDG